MKYAIVGTGSRHAMFRKAVTETYPDRADLVGLCDVNPRRLALAAAAVPDPGGNGIASYSAEGFAQMLSDQRPDRVVVTVPDDLHHDYIVAAMRAGSDVITEKPMTIDLAKLKAVLDAQRETGRQIRVAFNYRYMAARTQIKDLLMSGAIGEITAIDFRWHLDRVHGADYFRRWHRYKDRSGGLLVHKSTHHFDLVNWWLSSVPETVTAHGARKFYTPATAAKFGLTEHGPRCHDCPEAARCPLRLDLAADDQLRALYLEAEQEDGYLRDQCVFDPAITIEDTMQVHARYRSGALLNYTLNAYSPWEGLDITFQGTEGELWHRQVEVHGVFGGKRAHAEGAESMTTVLHRAGEAPQTLEVWQGGPGGHGGADPVMLGYLFDAQTAPDRYGRSSTHIDGAWSILTGIAANISIARGQSVSVAELLAEHGISLPA